MRLEYFLLICVLMIWLSMQGYLNHIKIYFLTFQNYLTMLSGGNNLKNLFLKFMMVSIIIIIVFPKAFKWFLSPFRGNKNGENPIKIIKEYNFVNSIRNITERAQEKNDNWKNNRKQLIVTSQKNKCFDCGLSANDAKITFKIPLHRGGSDDISNLKGICQQCFFRNEIQNSYL